MGSIGKESAGGGLDFSIDPINDLNNLYTLGTNVAGLFGYRTPEQKMAADQWGMQKQKMTQDFIKQEREMERQKKIRDLMLGIGRPSQVQ